MCALACARLAIDHRYFWLGEVRAVWCAYVCANIYQPHIPLLHAGPLLLSGPTCRPSGCDGVPYLGVLVLHSSRHHGSCKSFSLFYKICCISGSCAVRHMLLPLRTWRTTRDLVCSGFILTLYNIVNP